jgi:hypothetical protein
MNADCALALAILTCARPLSATALATQGFADAVLPTGQRRPLSLSILSIAASGKRKTSTDNEALIRAVGESS